MTFTTVTVKWRFALLVGLSLAAGVPKSMSASDRGTIVCRLDATLEVSDTDCNTGDTTHAVV
ncbi:MAG: hypothetical protein WBN30_09875 [Polyangiales bacterium]